jgi:hypothetical protein
MSSPGRIGVALGAAVLSAAAQKRKRDFQKREQRRNERRAGELVVRQVDPKELSDLDSLPPLRFTVD